MDNVLASDLASRRKRWARADYRFLAGSGLLDPQRRYELIEGDIIEQMPRNQPHITANDSGYELLTDIFGRGFVRHSALVALSSDSEPEADIAVTWQHRQVYAATGTPPASEVVLAMEIPDTTLRYDLTTKAAVYAGAGIPGYWVVSLNDHSVIVHQNPTPTGYTTVTILDDTQSVSPLAAPRASLFVAQLLP